jgi:SH3-like domain-containing protein
MTVNGGLTREPIVIMNQTTVNNSPDCRFLVELLSKILYKNNSIYSIPLSSGNDLHPDLTDIYMRNNYQKSLVFGALIILTLLLTVPAPAAEYVSVKKDGVNIRSGPGTNKEVLWEVFKDFPLEVIKHQKDWVQTTDFEGDQGWIHDSLVAKDKRVIVKVNTANMRIGPAQNYEIVATVKYGVVFTPLEKEGDWIKVKHEDGTTGWISGKLLWPSNPL